MDDLMCWIIFVTFMMLSCACIAMMLYLSWITIVESIEYKRRRDNFSDMVNSKERIDV
jgi:hypothetical protein